MDQLLEIYNTVTIISRLDQGKYARFVFCNISKAIDKVWHKGLLYKLNQNDIYGNILDCIY